MGLAQDVCIEGAKVTPPMIISAATMNGVVTALTILYLLMQIYYLIKKHRPPKESDDGKPPS